MRRAAALLVALMLTAPASASVHVTRKPLPPTEEVKWKIEWCGLLVIIPCFTIYDSKPKAPAPAAPCPTPKFPLQPGH